LSRARHCSERPVTEYFPSNTREASGKQLSNRVSLIYASPFAVYDFYSNPVLPRLCIGLHLRKDEASVVNSSFGPESLLKIDWKRFQPPVPPPNLPEKESSPRMADMWLSDQE